MAIACVSSLSPDATVYPEASDWLPPRRANLEDPQIRDIHKLLDAIVYFLPTSKDDVFALSLEVGDEVAVALSGNDGKHFEQMFGRTPAETVLFIWDKLKCIAQSDRENSQLTELVLYLLRRQDGRIETRFRKSNEPCKQFFELVRDPERRSQYTPEQIKFLDAAEDVFLGTSEFFEFPLEKREASYNAYVLRLQRARTSYKQDAVKPPYPWHDLEVKVTKQCELQMYLFPLEVR